MKIGEDNILRSSAVIVLNQFPAFESAIRNRFRVHDRIIVTLCDFLKFKNFTNSTSKTNTS